MKAPDKADGDVRQAPGALVQAVLRELAELLDALARDPAREAAIDLRGLPLDDTDREALRRFLGEGEVDAACDVVGASRVKETSFAGVWWVRHAAADGATLVEQVVVARAPSILLAHPSDIAVAQQDLVRLLGGLRAAAAAGSLA